MNDHFQVEEGKSGKLPWFASNFHIATQRKGLGMRYTYKFVRTASACNHGASFVRFCDFERFGLLPPFKSPFQAWLSAFENLRLWMKYLLGWLTLCKGGELHGQVCVWLLVVCLFVCMGCVCVLYWVRVRVSYAVSPFFRFTCLLGGDVLGFWGWTFWLERCEWVFSSLPLAVGTWMGGVFSPLHQIFGCCFIVRSSSPLQISVLACPVGCFWLLLLLQAVMQSSPGDTNL